MKPLLQVKGLSKSFGALNVLSSLDLEVAEGEFVSVLGESGGGKSTLLRLIAGFEKPNSGEIWLGETLVSDSTHHIDPAHRGIGIVPQDAALFPHLTVAENIGFGLNKLAENEKRDRINEMLELVGLVEEANKLPREISGGQQQRVALARALAIRPKIVLLDEPFSALDAQLRTRLRDEVKEVLAKVNATVLLVTHDQDEALSIADRVAVLRDGVIVQADTPSEMYNNPEDVRLATFLGEAVVLPAQIVGGKARTPVGDLALTGEYSEGQRGQVAVRPENFYLQPDLNGKASVIGRQYFGHDAMTTVESDDFVIRARTAGPLAPEVGMKVTVWVRGQVNFYPVD
jgi:iron(III) transport system ATP-binding protein